MRSLEDSDIEHRGPLVFSQTAAAVLLVAIFSGGFAAIVLHSHIESFLPLFLLTLASVAVALALISRRTRLSRAGNIRLAMPPERPDLEALGELHEFLEASPTLLGIVELSNKGLVHVFDNPAASRFFATESEVSSSHSSTDKKVHAANELFREQCLESKARNAPVRFEFQIAAAGQRRWFTATVFPTRSRNIERARFAYLAENISPAKENELALVEARERLAAALEAGSLATWDWDVQRDVVYGDSVLVELYGVPAEYMRGAPAHKFLEHIHPDDRERVRKEINSTLETGKVYKEQYRVVGRGGKIRWVSATGRMVADASGKPARLPGVAIDITHLKQVEEELQQATVLAKNRLQELESVYTYAPVGLGVVDSERRWQRVNKVMAEYFGKAPADFKGRPIAEVVPTIAEEFDRHVCESIQTKKPVLNVAVSGECPITRGSIRTWNSSFYPLIDTENRVVGINVVTEDVTEDRRATEEHRAHRAILEMVALQEPLDVVLNTLTDAVEGIFPGAISYILRDHDGARPVAPLPQASHQTIDSIFSPPLTKDELKVITDVIDTRQELLISDLSERSDIGFLARVRQVGLKSTWIKPIALSDGSVWGACAVHHPKIAQNPTHGEREHLEVLLRLAATVIERKAFLDQLTSTTERLQYAERAGRIGVFDWNPLTGRVVWTPQLEDLYGMPQGSFEGNYEGWRKRVHPDDVGAVTERLAQLMAHKESHFQYEYRFIRPDGEVRWTSDQGEFSYNEAGQATRMIGVAIDVTERKRLEEQGKRDQERLSLALEAGNLGLWDWHIPSGRVLFGGNWGSMLGYNADELEPHVRTWEVLVHPDDKSEVEAKLKKHLAGETLVYEAEHRLRMKSGQWIWILDRGRVIERDGHGNAIRAVGVHTDINEHRMIREKLNSEAKRKDEFIATLAHELRNPLAPLRTGLEILRRDPTGKGAVQAIEMMNRQLVHMVRLIEDLLDVSRISLGRLELRIQRISLLSIIEAALEHSRPAIESAKHELIVRLPKEEVLIEGDFARLSQVVANLLINAAKYTPPGGKIVVEARVDRNTVMISVVDSGIGIPGEKLTEIFDMFSQVVSPLDRTQGGLGIGLALVRKLVQMHEGEVFAESAGPGLGSRFTVKLPRVVEAAPSQVSKEAPTGEVGETREAV
jgi:PAS domain S-box-containing protein